jgi:peptide-methionine (S)-S-oxide reductase
MSKQRLVLGGGCFWCVEAVFSDVKGVSSAISGYAGGARANPTYENVCSGATGHAEIVDISYDDEIVSLEDLLKVFFVIHDPTTLNRQGADKGTQYRSVIYYSSEEEKDVILKAIDEAQENYEEKIVTEVSQLPEVYPAEAYHQNYYKLNPMQGYCQVVIRPKVQKFMTQFTHMLG